MTLDREEAGRMAEAYAAAWSAGRPEGVAAFYAEDGRIVINDGEPVVGRAALADMAAAFYAEFPGLTVRLDDFRVAGSHALFAWTLEGTHGGTGNRVSVPGWEEWTLDSDLKVASSLGWFDAAEYDRQIREGV